MAEADLRLVLRTVADTKGAEQTSAALRRVQQETAQTTTTTQQAALSVLRWAGGLGLAATAAGALGHALSASLEVHKEFARVNRAVAAAYGSNASSFTRFSEALAQQTGFSSRAILEAALSARTLSANYGLTIQQTQNLIKASADLATVRGIGVAEAFERVQSAIRGEAEASEFLGLTLNDTFIKNNALNGSVRTTFEKMTDAEKAQIRYGELLRQTAQFSGLAARGADSLEGAQRRAAASTEALGKTMGSLLAPALKDVALAQDQATIALGKWLEQWAKTPTPQELRERAVAIEKGLPIIGPLTAPPAATSGLIGAVPGQTGAGALRASLEQKGIISTAAQGRVTQTAAELRAGERRLGNETARLREIAYMDQRNAAVRDLLAAQREEVALKEQLTRMEREQGDMAQRRYTIELATINAQQRALPAQQALQDTERAVERARLVLGIRGTSLEQRQAARATIRGAERNILPAQRLAAFDVETGLIGAQRAETAFDQSARIAAIGMEQAIAGQKTLVNAALTRTDEAMNRLEEIVREAITHRPLQPVNITLQVLGPDGQMIYEELVEAADQAAMPPVIRVSGVRR